MAKFDSGEIIQILRKFKIANEDNVPRNIEELKKHTPDEFSEVFSFKFLSTKYYAVVDGTAEDDENYILNLLRTMYGDIEGDLLKNPNDDLLSFAMPFKGKDVYLFKNVSSRRRLDVILSEKLFDISRSSIQKYIKNGYVKVNSKEILQSKSLVSKFDKIELNIPEKIENKISFPIIYQDENVIVIDKPAGILTHSKGVLNDEYTVADFFAENGAEFAKETNRAGIVHRLDRGTSGVIIGAKNEQTAKKLQKQFSDRATKKTYFAVSEGELEQNEAMIDLPIARNQNAPSTFKIDARGKSAQTKYEVIEQNNNLILLKLNPKTGRTHQLRVHLAYLKAPILGDHVYNNSKIPENTRMFLHASSLEITIPPIDGSKDSLRKTFVSQTPKEFSEVVHREKRF